VAVENPELYFEIQSLNEYGSEALTALRNAIARVHATVSAGDEKAFCRMMERGCEYFADVARLRGSGVSDTEIGLDPSSPSAIVSP
jgi:chorismate mutase/prephenate dehydrogenase